MRSFWKVLVAVAVLVASICAGVWLARDDAADDAVAPVEESHDLPPALASPSDEQSGMALPPAFDFAPPGELAPVSTRLIPAFAKKENVARLVDDPGNRGGEMPEADDPSNGEHPLFAMLRERDSEPVPAEVAELAEKIVEGATNKIDKARAIYDWITDNIRYDIDEWMYVVGGGSGYSHDHDPASVLARGTTVCIGYSWLFDAMARSVGLDATYLVGDSRGYRGTPEDDAASGFKHAWNAVAVDDGWALLDATWGSRQVGEDDSTFLSRADYYFDTPPDQMIFDHLPESPEWQLLDNPIPDAGTFQDLPNLKPSFFENGIRIATPFSSAAAIKNGAMEPIVVQAGDGVRLAATVTTDGKTTQVPVLHSANGNGLAMIDPPSRPPVGSVVRLYVKGVESQWYECAADFVVE